MSQPANLNTQTLANQLNLIKDKMIVQKGRSDQNTAEAISRGIDEVIQLITPWITDYQVLQQKVKDLEQRVPKLETKKTDHPANTKNKKA